MPENYLVVTNVSGLTITAPESPVDVTFIVRGKHKALWEAAKKVGGQSALARYIGEHAAIVGRWINLQECPRVFESTPDRRWSDSRRKNLEKKLYELTGLMLEELFPPALREEKFLKTPKTMELSSTVDEGLLLSGPGMRPIAYEPEFNESEEKEVLETVRAQLKILSYREREILKLRYGFGDGDCYTLEEVGHIFKLTKERIRQIERSAIKKLRSGFRLEALEAATGWTVPEELVEVPV